jgi:hypothetical protein
MTTPTPPDVPSLQLEVLKNIQAELVNLRLGLDGVRKDLDTGLSAVRAEMHEGFTRLRTEIVGLRGDMEVGFTALRMQNDRRYLDHERRIRDLEAARGGSLGE